MAKPIKSLELHYPMIQFLINICNNLYALISKTLLFQHYIYIIYMYLYQNKTQGGYTLKQPRGVTCIT